MQVLEGVALTCRPLGQRGEVEAVETRAERALQSPPELQLAGDSDQHHFQLEQPAERRVAGQLAVRLQAAELLPGRGQRWLDPAPSDPETLHELFESGAVGLDLGAYLRQRLAQLRVLPVAFAQPGSHPDPDRRSGQVVVQVDGQVAARVPAHSRSRSGAEASAPARPVRDPAAAAARARRRVPRRLRRQWPLIPWGSPGGGLRRQWRRFSGGSGGARTLPLVDSALAADIVPRTKARWASRR